MPDKTIVENYNFDISDDFIHELAPAILLSEQSSEFTLSQGRYIYRVRGGENGYLYYKRRTSDNWIMIANWCFYGLHIVIRYRKSLWLRSMYRSLFRKMNFVSITFLDHSIELVGIESETLRSRRFRLSPPSALTKVMSERFGYTQEEVEELKAKLDL